MRAFLSNNEANGLCFHDTSQARAHAFSPWVEKLMMKAGGKR